MLLEPEHAKKRDILIKPIDGMGSLVIGVKKWFTFPWWHQGFIIYKLFPKKKPTEFFIDLPMPSNLIEKLRPKENDIISITVKIEKVSK